MPVCPPIVHISFLPCLAGSNDVTEQLHCLEGGPAWCGGRGFATGSANDKFGISCSPVASSPLVLSSHKPCWKLHTADTTLYITVFGTYQLSGNRSTEYGLCAQAFREKVAVVLIEEMDEANSSC